VIVVGQTWLSRTGAWRFRSRWPISRRKNGRAAIVECGFLAFSRRARREKKRPPAGGSRVICWSRWETYGYVVVGRLTSVWRYRFRGLDVFLPWAKNL